MRRRIEEILARFGTDMRVNCGGREKVLRGFFHMVRSASWQGLEGRATLLGEVSRGQYIYIGPPDGGVQEGDSLRLGDRAYLFLRVENSVFRGAVIYQWGVCIEKGVSNSWATLS